MPSGSGAQSLIIKRCVLIHSRNSFSAVIPTPLLLEGWDYSLLKGRKTHTFKKFLSGVPIAPFLIKKSVYQ